jgi:hypothetical protein
MTNNRAISQFTTLGYNRPDSAGLSHWIAATAPFLLAAPLLVIFVTVPAKADPCPGSDTCPIGQYATGESTSANVYWQEPDQVPYVYGYYIQSNPPAPNQPLQRTTTNPNDWENAPIYGLKPGQQYTFTICAFFDASNQSCVTTSPVTTKPASTGGASTPTPTITRSQVTTNSIFIAWDGGGVNYDRYHVQLDDLPPQSEAPGGVTGSWTFGPPGQPLRSGTSYKVEVQGCLNWGWSSRCSEWATENITTASPPPPPPPKIAGPQNLHTTSTGCCQIDVLWTDPPGWGRVSVTRTPDWVPNVSPTSWQSSTDLRDQSIIPGMVYTYTVCLIYPPAGGTACASIMGTTAPGAPPPPAQPQNCQLSFTCPNPVYTPPNYTIQCPSPEEFYEQGPLGAMSFLDKNKQYSSVSSDYDVSIRACIPGTNSCSQYAVGKSTQEWCAPPPPAPPPGGGPPGGCGAKGCGGKCPGGICQ